MEGDILQHMLLTIRIDEGYVLEADVASYRTFSLNLAIKERLAHLTHDFHQATVRNHSRGCIHDDSSQVADGPDQPDDQTHISNVHSNGDLATDRHGRRVDETKQHL